MPNPIDNSFINAQFKTFVDFARGKDAGTKVRALVGNEGQERTVALDGTVTSTPMVVEP